MKAPIVIVGTGQAGVRAAETLRKLGCDEPIIMFGDEVHPPYQRPPLSKKFLLGEITEDQLYLQGGAFFERNAVDLQTGKRVLAIEPRERRLTVSGSTAPLTYGKLLLATGCRPRPLTTPGADAVDLLTLRSIDDVARLRQKLARAVYPVIIGGGYIGLEVAAVLRAMGKPVILLEAQDRLLARVTGPAVSGFFYNLHQAHGVDIRLNAQVVRLERDGATIIIGLADGQRIGSDLVLAAIGALANDELAREAGLPANDGVLVDEFCRLAPDIFAAGDCTRFPLPRYRRLVRLESVQNANDQARVAAEAMIGKGRPYDAVPWFWSDQYDVKLQIAGLADGSDEERIEGDPAGQSFEASFLGAGRLLAVHSVNNPRSHMLARRAIAQEPALALAGSDSRIAGA